MWPVFILDPWFVNPTRVGHNRMLFLLDSLRDLDTQLRRLGSRLFVLRGQPQEVLEERFDTWQIGRLCFERDTEPYARNRDSHVSTRAQSRGIEVTSPTAHTLFDPDLTIATGGHAPTTYSAFLRVLKKLGAPARPLNAPRDLPPPGECDPEAHGIPTLGELGYDVKDNRQPTHSGGDAGRERFIRATVRRLRCRTRLPRTYRRARKSEDPQHRADASCLRNRKKYRGQPFDCARLERLSQR